MRAVGIVGYKNSGKTSLLATLARELANRNLTVSSVKHSSCSLDLPETDTAIHKKFAHQVAAIADKESAIFFQKSMALEEMLNYLKADIILIEGFKREKTFPKIVCFGPENDLESLMDGLEICVVGAPVAIQQNINVPVLNAKRDIGKIADLAVEKAFKLPNMDCGACGYNTCYDLALQIVKGNNALDDCKSLNSGLQIKIDGKIVPIKPFVSDIVGNTLIGMLSSLKGFRKGEIEIKIEQE